MENLYDVLNSISEENLKRINSIIDQDRIEIIFSGIDFNYWKQVYYESLSRKRYLKEGLIKNVIPMKRSEMIKTALDFFKTIDIKYYERAKDVILNIDKQAKISIYKSENKKDDGELITSMGKSQLKIPTQMALKGNEKMQEEMCTLEDVFTLVHEISHLFDLNPKNSIPRLDIKEGQKSRYENNRVRDLFGESTAFAFEILLTEYLLENTNYSNYAIKQIYNTKNNLLLDTIGTMYYRILLVENKKNNQDITRLSLRRFIRKNQINPQNLQFLISTMLKDNYSFIRRNKYAVASLIAPTIVKKYKECGKDFLTRYIDVVKNDKVEDISSILGINFSESGIKMLVTTDIEQENRINLFDRNEKKLPIKYNDFEEKHPRLSKIPFINKFVKFLDDRKSKEINDKDKNIETTGKGFRESFKKEIKDNIPKPKESEEVVENRKDVIIEDNEQR